MMKIKSLNQIYNRNFVLSNEQQLKNKNISQINFKAQGLTQDTITFSETKTENTNKTDKLEQLEGIQKGIKVFEGLTLKEIDFIGKNLSVIAAKQGCRSNCVHCFADAKPPIKENANTINSISFEDLQSVLQGFAELKKRTGINFIKKADENGNITLIFDADNIDLEIKDKKGNIYEFPELNKMLYDATEKPGLFDTSGWNVKSKKHQERAERIAEYYSKPEHQKEIHQFNLSINPFHSIYVKSLELKEKGDVELAKKLYNIYVNRISNALFTFIPLMDCDKFGAILRAFPDDVLKMDGHDRISMFKLVYDIKENFKKRCLVDLKTDKKYIKSLSDYDKYTTEIDEKLKRIDSTYILIGNRLERFIKNKYPSLSQETLEQKNLTAPKQESKEEIVPKLKKDLDIDSYIKLIDVTGKVYVSDNYRVIPTNIQLNYENKNKIADTFHPLSNEYTITKDMI